MLVHARGADQARRAVDQLVTNGNGKGQYLAVAGDLGSLAGVRELVDAVHEAAPRLEDVFIELQDTSGGGEP